MLPVDAVSLPHQAWSPLSAEGELWLQVNLPKMMRITAVATQGRQGAGEWVRSYVVSSRMAGMPGEVWATTEAAYEANTDEGTVVRCELKEAELTNSLRIIPRTWHKHPSMRLALYGCEHTTTKRKAEPLLLQAEPVIPPPEVERALVVVDGELRFYSGHRVVAQGPVGSHEDAFEVWHHVAASFDAGAATIHLWVDGAQVGTGELKPDSEHDKVEAVQLGGSTALGSLLGKAALTPDGGLAEVLFTRGTALKEGELLALASGVEGPEDDIIAPEDAQAPSLHLRWPVVGNEAYVVQKNDHFVYEVFWEGDSHLGVALDIAAADGTALRDTGTTDGMGLLTHPSTDLREHAGDAWYTRIIKLPPSFEGQKIPHYFIACEKPGGGEARALLRNVRFVSAARGNPVRYTVLPDIKTKQKRL